MTAGPALRAPIIDSDRSSAPLLGERGTGFERRSDENLGDWDNWIILTPTKPSATGSPSQRGGEYQELADLSHSTLGHRPDDFMSTYFLGLAEIGRGSRIFGHRLQERVEAIFPRIRDYGFIASYMRRRGYAEIDILFQRLWLLAVFRATDSFRKNSPWGGTGVSSMPVQR